MTTMAQLQLESNEGFRISPQQKRLWQSMQRYPEVSFAAQCLVKITGPLHVERLNEAILGLRKTHEILRTRFVLLPGTRMPVQVIGSDISGLAQRFDLKDRSSVQAASEIEFIRKTLWNQARWNSEYSGMNFTLINVTDRKDLLLVTACGLYADAATLAAIVREVRDSYSGSPLPGNQAPQYADISEWQNQLLENDAMEHDVYWKAPDFSLLRFPHLPFERRNPQPGNFSPGTLVRDYSGTEMPWLSEAGGRLGIGIEAVLMAVYQILISRLSSLDRFLVGVRVDGRTPAELRDAIGLFAKSMPLAATFDKDQSFVQLAHQVSKTMELAGYDQASFDTEAYASSESPQRCPVPLVFSAAPVAALQPVESANWEIASLEDCLEPFELAVTAATSGGSLRTLRFSWDQSVFDEQEILLLAGFYADLLQQVASDPDRPLHCLNLGSQSPAALVTGKAMDETAPRGVHAWIEDQCVLAPHRIAAVCGSRQISYGELNRRASLLAGRLIRLGAAPETVVAIMAQRSIDFIVAVFAVLKSGAAWLPVDPDTPVERTGYMIAQAAAIVALADNGSRPRLQQLEIPVIQIDERFADDEAVSFAGPGHPAFFPEQLAYVIFTSGSTGYPKGVGIEHRQLMSYILGLKADTDLPRCASYALVSTMAADLGHTAVFAALTSGACLHVVPSFIASDMTALAEYFLERPVDCIKIVPAHLEALCRSLPPETKFPWRALILGGEPLTWELTQLFRKFAPHSVVLNEYGPTETTVGVISAAAEISRERFNTTEAPIGRPRAGVSARVLDQSLRPVPAWVTGDLYIGGSCVGRGYIGAGALTAERFLPDPFQHEPGARMYATGDRARYRGDGTLEFLGRRDGQVKLRGYRIELSEIEATLCRHPQVQAAIVMLLPGQSGGKMLAAWVAGGQAKILPEELRRFASDSLPGFMVPAVFTCVDRFRLTPNGKVDRLALPPAAVQVSGSAGTPFDEMEESLAAVWQKVLGKEGVNVDDNYFALGGDSLRVVQIVHESQRYGINLRAMDILRHQTIRNLSKALQREHRQELFAGGIPEDSFPLPEELSLRLPDLVDAYPVSGIQSFVLEKYAMNQGDDGVYHVQECFHMEDIEFSQEALEAAFAAVVARHPALRTVFYLKNDPPLQCVRQSLPWKVVTRDISHLDVPAQDSHITEEIRFDRRSLFDTASLDTPLFRIAVFLRSPSRFSLLFSCHHAIMDGWGYQVFLNHLVEAYTAIKSGRAPDLGEPDHTYRQFVNFELAVCRSEQAKQFWRSILPGVQYPSLPELIPISCAVAGEPVMSVEFSPEQVSSWGRIAREHAVSMQALLLAAWLEALREWSGESLVSTGVISNGRSEYLTDPLSALGLFWNVAPVISRTRLSLLQQAVIVQKYLVEIQPYSSYPLPQLIIDNGGEDLFYSVFRYLNFWNTKEIPDESGLRFLGNYVFDRYPFVLSCTAAIAAAGRYFQIEYDPKSISPESVKNLLASCKRLLEEITPALN